MPFIIYEVPRFARQSRSLSRGINEPTMRLTRHANDFFVGVYSGRGGGGGEGEGGKKNRGIFLASLQLAFKERVVPATQAFDWSLGNRC